MKSELTKKLHELRDLDNNLKPISATPARFRAEENRDKVLSDCIALSEALERGDKPVAFPTLKDYEKRLEQKFAYELQPDESIDVGDPMDAIPVHHAIRIVRQWIIDRNLTMNQGRDTFKMLQARMENFLQSMREEYPPKTNLPPEGMPVEALCQGLHGEGWMPVFYGAAKTSSEPDANHNIKKCWRHCNTEDEVNCVVKQWKHLPKPEKPRVLTENDIVNISHKLYGIPYNSSNDWCHNNESALDHNSGFIDCFRYLRDNRYLLNHYGTSIFPIEEVIDCIPDEVANCLTVPQIQSIRDSLTAKFINNTKK